MFTPRDFVWGIALPALIAALLMAIAWRPGRKDCPLAGGFWGGSLALAASFAIAFPGLARRSPVPPFEATDWLFVIALYCSAAGIIDGLCEIPTRVRDLISTGLLMISCWLLLRLVNGMNSGVMVGWVLGLGLVFAIWWMLLDRFARVRRGATVPGLLTVLAACAGLVLLLSRSQLIGQLGGAVAAAMGGCLVVAWFSSSLSLSRGLTLVFVALFAGLLICAHFYASLDWLNGLLVVVAAIMATAGLIVPEQLLHGWKRTVVLISLVLLPASIAIILAAIEFAESMSAYSY